MGRTNTLARLDTPQTVEALARIQSASTADLMTPGRGMIYGAEVKYVTWKVPPDIADLLYIILITDVQFGSIACREDKVIEYRDWVLAAPNRFMVWGGDMIDAGAKLTVGDPLDQRGIPLSQVWRMAELWAPARHRILGYVGGNHERRAEPLFGDLGTLLAALLKIPYSRGRQFLDVHFGKHQPFKITLWHGVGGARTKGTVAQILNRFMQEGDSQLYLMGHLHQPLVMPIWKEQRDRAARTIDAVKCIGAVGSSFLESFGTYGEIRGYPASGVLQPCCQLEATGKWQVNLR